MRKGKAIFVVVMFLFCEVLTIGWLRDSVQTLWWQYRAQSFPSTPGRIISSRVLVTHGSKATHYDPEFVYVYAVGGQTLTGQRYRYARIPFEADAAQVIVAAHPVGSEVPVYYDPIRPDNALLDLRLFPEAIYWPFFIAAMALGILLLLSVSISELREAWSTRPAGGFPILSQGSVVRVQLPRFLPLTGALIVAAGGSVLTGIGFSFEFDVDLSHLPLEIQTALILVAGLTLLAYAGQAWRIASGEYDLVIDEAARTVQLPLTFGRKTRQPIPFSELERVSLPPSRNVTKGGSVYYTYVATLHIVGREPEQLTNDLNEERARPFAAWMRDCFGLPQPEI